MTKIMVSLRSVYIIGMYFLAYANSEVSGIMMPASFVFLPYYNRQNTTILVTLVILQV
ncbi:hypothetical protein D1AOALGA4SA_2666 [Olavius algarvensis Delta 1 endosymbiont]|nr:hypothetical protein D1AOALGA4SA_2666 [Olavius algarvensis Delta 1 endosymbiont]